MKSLGTRVHFTFEGDRELENRLINDYSSKYGMLFVYNNPSKARTIEENFWLDEGPVEGCAHSWGRLRYLENGICSEPCVIHERPRCDYLTEAFNTVRSWYGWRRHRRDPAQITFSISSKVRQILLYKYDIRCAAQLDNITHLGDKDSLFAKCDVQRLLKA